MPLPIADLVNFGEVASANPKNNLFRCYLFRPRPLEQAWKFTERARTNVVERGNLLPKLFIPTRQYLCAAKSQFTNDFRKKSDLPDVAFDQEDLQARSNDFQRQTRKSGSRSYVGQPTVFDRNGLGRVHTLTKMTIKYLQRVTNRG